MTERDPMERPMNGDWIRADEKGYLFAVAFVTDGWVNFRRFRNGFNGCICGRVKEAVWKSDWAETESTIITRGV